MTRFIPPNWGAIPFFVLCTSEDIVPHILRMMTALTNTSSPELPHSLTTILYKLLIDFKNFLD